jgi:hypothetical protein
MSSVMDESCVIILNTDYATDYVKHQLNDALVIKRKLDLNPPTGCVFEHTLTPSIDTTSSPNLGVVGEKILHYRKSSVESRVKRVVKRKLASRSKIPPANGWILNDKEFNELHNLCKFTVEGCCDSLGLNGHGVYFFTLSRILY